MTRLIDTLAAELGNPADFIMTADKRRTVQRWAAAAGHKPFDVNAMSNVELANLYCGQTAPAMPAPVTAPAMPMPHVEPTEQQIAASTALVTLMSTLNVLTEDRCRQIAAEVMAEFGGTAKRIEIVTPRATVKIEGSVHAMTERVIQVAALGHPVMMVGPAGCGKTTIGEHVAKALALDCYITSTVNDTHELTGFVDGHGKYHTTQFRLAYENGGVWVADEIDAWDAPALLAANAALANGICSFPDREKPIKRHADFRMVATANTFGHGADRVYVGRNELDAASLDRFATLDVGYDLDLERAFAGDNVKWLDYVWNIRKQVEAKKIRHVVSSRAIIMGAQALAVGIPEKDVREYYVFKGMSATDRSKLAP